jgi:non-specific serine/threonine protein kinase/serine/threonine-protein kinase
MIQEHWVTLKEKLQAALDLAPEQRRAFLNEAAGSNPELRRELESLLAAHEQAGTNFLNTPPAPAIAITENLERAELFIGRRIGPYQIVNQIGAGGMGEVYRAFRIDEYEKEVAIKVVRAGQESGFSLSRFKNERQILARLDHPNIAHLLDGGTTEAGRPYLVMEFIEGKPIDDYCDSHKLSTEERLRLFLQVCSAVQYAHQRLIIHRDIKPSNILVTSAGAPKLLDFGIAKILDTETAGQHEPTLTIFRALTPGYASPEQVKGEPITTASDVYSLGVVLYELLTGRHPYRRPNSTAQDISRAVCEVEPEKPSTAVKKRNVDESAGESHSYSADGQDNSARKLSQRLRGDIDNIVLMALRKESQRRYTSVEQFAEDIRRHLENLPVLARKDTVVYRTSKFINRHKAGVVAAILLTLILLGALAITLWEARVAREQAGVARSQEARAERRFNDVRKLANSLIFEVHDSIRNLPGATQARKLVVSRALEYLDSLSREASGDPSLQRELATAYDTIGDVLGYSGTANLGDFQGAAASYAKALAIWEALAAANPTDVNVQLGLGSEYFRITQVLENIGDFAAARATMERAQPLVRRMMTEQNNPKLQTQLAGLYYYTAGALEKTGDFSGALQNYRQAAAILEPIAADPSTNIYVRAYLPANYEGVARMLAETGKIDEGIAMATDALHRVKTLSAANPTNATLSEDVAEGYGTLGDIQRKKGHFEAALSSYRSEQSILHQLSSADANNQQAILNLGFIEANTGEILMQQGKVSKGLHSVQKVITIVRAAPGSKNLWIATGLSECYADLGSGYAALAERAISLREKLEYWREARSWYEKGMDIWTDNPKSGGLDAFGHNQAAQLSQEIAKCDVGLRAMARAKRPRN